jgi:hypothetical protein
LATNDGQWLASVFGVALAYAVVRYPI